MRLYESGGFRRVPPFVRTRATDQRLLRARAPGGISTGSADSTRCVLRSRAHATAAARRFSRRPSAALPVQHARHVGDDRDVGEQRAGLEHAHPVRQLRRARTAGRPPRLRPRTTRPSAGRATAPGFDGADGGVHQHAGRQQLQAGAGEVLRPGGEHARRGLCRVQVQVARQVVEEAARALVHGPHQAERGEQRDRGLGRLEQRDRANAAAPGGIRSVRRLLHPAAADRPARLLAERVSQRRGAVEHQPPRRVVDAVGDEVAVALELQMRLGGHGGEPGSTIALAMRRLAGFRLARKSRPPASGWSSVNSRSYRRTSAGTPSCAGTQVIVPLTLIASARACRSWCRGRGAPDLGHAPSGPVVAPVHSTTWPYFRRTLLPGKRRW